MSRIRIAVTVLAVGVAVSSLAYAAQAPATAKATTAPTSSSAPAHKSSTHKSSKAMHIDLNSATREQLMTLPGVTDATADKIIAARPFKSKEELKSKNILTKAEYDKLASKVSAKAEPAAKK